MAAIERSAYPRFASRLSTRELVRHFTPSEAELEWAKSKVRGLRLQHAILVNLKCFQLLHYFPADGDIPSEVTAHVATVLSLKSSPKPSRELSSATRYRQHADRAMRADAHRGSEYARHFPLSDRALPRAIAAVLGQPKN